MRPQKRRCHHLRYGCHQSDIYLCCQNFFEAFVDLPKSTLYHYEGKRLSFYERFYLVGETNLLMCWKVCGFVKQQNMLVNVLGTSRVRQHWTKFELSVIVMQKACHSIKLRPFKAKDFHKNLVTFSETDHILFYEVRWEH